MLLPSKLKKLNLFLNGAWLSETKSVKLPFPKFKREDWKGIKWRTGAQEDSTFEFSLGGLSIPALASIGGTKIDDTQLRFAGAYQADDTGVIHSVELVVQGQTNEVDGGDAEEAKDTEHKYVVDWVYYKLTIDGADVLEIDKLRQITKVQGVDIEADLRTAAGL